MSLVTWRRLQPGRPAQLQVLIDATHGPPGLAFYRDPGLPADGQYLLRITIMTQLSTLLRISSLALLIGAASSGAWAATTPGSFVDDASAGGIAEVQAAQVALQKGTADDVKAFANMMIKDHTAANDKLASLAKDNNLSMSTHAQLMVKAKTMILKMRKGESFDVAYANNQVKAHEQTIALFQQEADSNDNPQLQAFAKDTLPTLQHHLEMAKALAAAHQQAN